MKPAAQGEADALTIEHCGRGLYVVECNGAVSEPVPWFRITVEFVQRVIEAGRVDVEATG